MKLTNIRIDNNFVIFDDKKFFRSSIDKGEYEKYIKNKRSMKLSDHKKDDVTDTLTGLMNKHNIISKFMPHPFYSYKIPKIEGIGLKCVSIARIDFDKNTDIILKANKLLPEELKITIYGAENRLYVFHKLKDLEFYNKSTLAA